MAIDFPNSPSPDDLFSSGGTTWEWTGIKWKLLTQGATDPVGSLLVTSPTAIPEGYLACDGSAVSRTTYADLFAAVGTNYGDGNGATTFNLPNYSPDWQDGRNLDTAFAPNVNGTINCTHVMPDGKILIGGAFSTVNGVARNSIARLNADGTLDETFNAAVLDQEVFAISNWFNLIIVGGDFGYVLDGEQKYSLAILQSNGSTNFLTGSVSSDSGAIRSLKKVSNNVFVVGGDFTALGGNAAQRLARIEFVQLFFLEITVANFGAINNTVYDVAVQSDGKVLIGGDFTTVAGSTRNRVARFNADRTLDTGFDPNANSRVSAVAVQSDGKVLIGGLFGSIAGQQRPNLVRLNADGTIDNGFNIQAISSGVEDVAVQSDQKILIGGTFVLVAGFERVGGARLNTDGSLDPLFDPKFDSEVRSINILPNDKILVGGVFFRIGNLPRRGVALLNPTGGYAVKAIKA
jgi:uncharacterized delta-60 repeat protein